MKKQSNGPRDVRGDKVKAVEGQDEGQSEGHNDKESMLLSCKN